MKETLVKVIALLGLVAILGLAACDVVATTSSAASSTTGTNSSSSSTVAQIGILTNVAVSADQILVAFDFSACGITPESGNVKPAVLGGLKDYGFADWGAAATNGNITAAGTGSQFLTKSGTYYYILLTMPDVIDYSITFKPINIEASQAGWDALTNTSTGVLGSGNWSGIGQGNKDNTLLVSNKLITSFNINNNTNSTVNSSTNGITISGDAKRVLIDIGANGGWSAQILGNISAGATATLIITNIPTFNVGSSLAADNVWLPLAGLISNTNTGATSAAVARFTGSETWLHTNTNAWTPGEGQIAVISGTTASYTFTVPSGAPRSFQFKLANTLGWNCGEMNNNVQGALPATGGVYTQYQNFKN